VDSKIPMQKAEPSERAWLLAKAVSGTSQTDALPLTNAELRHLQARVIARENLVKVLLVDAQEHQVELMREVAALISPRPSCTQHPHLRYKRRPA
jgi:hypothetical protein